VGEVGTLRVDDCDPVEGENGERCTLVVVRDGS